VAEPDYNVSRVFLGLSGSSRERIVMLQIINRAQQNVSLLSSSDARLCIPSSRVNNTRVAVARMGCRRRDRFFGIDGAVWFQIEEPLSRLSVRCSTAAFYNVGNAVDRADVGIQCQTTLLRVSSSRFTASAGSARHERRSEHISLATSFRVAMT